MTTNIITAVVTAYCACRVCCGPNAAGITAAGTRPVAGRTVAAPRWVPLGSRVRINGRWYVAEDRTARRYDGRWDIFFRSHDEARAFGKQTNRVEICR